jgi:transcription-repair coupling factor (superfamily II helicase)
VTTSTSLNLRALLKRAIVQSGIMPLGSAVSGLTSSAKALLVAAASHASPNLLVLYVVPSDGELERGAADARFFLGALEGLSDRGIEDVVLPYPSHEVDPYRGLPPHLGVASARARALHAMARGRARIVVASAAALVPRVSAPQRMLSAALDLRPGQEIAPSRLADLLTDAGFSREDPTDEPGEFAIRGGIVDVFPPSDPLPTRIEFIGDTIESLRSYAPATQRSVSTIDQVAIRPLRDVLPSTTRPVSREDASLQGDEGPQGFSESVDRTATIFDYLLCADESRIITSEPDEVEASANKLLAQLDRSYEVGAAGLRTPPSLGTDAATAVYSTPDHAPADVPPPSELAVDWPALQSHLERGTVLHHVGVDSDSSHVRCQPVVELRGRVDHWVADIRRLRSEGDAALFVAATPGRAERTIELLKEYDVFAAPIERAEDAQYAAVQVAIGTLSHGFRLPDARLQIYSERDVFEEEHRAPERRRAPSHAFLSDLRDLKVGDFVVHVDHGIGAFVGLRQLGVGDSVHEFLELQYADADKLFVPIERLDLVQKYAGGSRPQVDRLGGTSWERAKTRVKKAMRDMAEELLKLYASRKAVPGHAFGSDGHWQEEFEGAFEYELTPDQQTAIADVKRDMEASTPMDRLLCGDVGYGKTEVAMRAAFKAVMDGKQVALLAPTTVLAFQHEKTLRERFAGFPVRTEMLSRFRGKSEQTQILADLAAGKVDIIVGTHRLLSKDVHFHDLGFLVVDEEQRFGVSHKEKIKQLKKKVDVLTMSATPIPRTLNMSLVGIRDMSVIETAPKDRLSIQTNLVKFNDEVIRRAIRNELERGGQVYFVHNRVESIFSIGALLQRLVPEARVVVGHGQLQEDQLERAMLDFVEGKYDVLLATTIIENGLDIPNVNTIIINRADRYGLSQLYQLRGRVGRSDRPAYAYLLVPPENNLSPIAKKRLAAIKEFTDLGSGFRVAALDLEIRGAGNLLGGEQSGHIDAVGFELYVKLLEEAVRELKGEELEADARATVNLGIDLRIDESYVPDMNQRLVLYRKFAAARQEAELERILDETVDRYGPPPASIENLAAYARIRGAADRLGIDSIDHEGQAVVIKFRAQAKVDPVRLVEIVRRRSDLALVPPAGLRLMLDRSPSVGSRDSAAGVRGTGNRPAPRIESRPTGRLPAGDRRAPKAGSSWWTSRAREREVKPGFTKEEILRAPKGDPRAAGGVFDRVGELLSTLLGGAAEEP